MAKPLSLIKLLVPFIFVFIHPYLSCPAHQKQILLHFKSSLLNLCNTSGSLPVGLESWNSMSDCCTWNRVVCSQQSGEITALHLNSLLDPLNGLLDPPLNSHFAPFDKVLMKPRILDPIYGIRSLMLLDISDNFINGEISGNGLANLTKLVHLDMSWNHFNGSIPDSIGNLKRLEILDLGYNYLQMQIPSVIGSLSNIFTLVLSNNSFTGVIPSSMRNLSKLETLQLEDNMLSGEIPSWLFDIESLEILNLEGNNLFWNNNVTIVPRCMLSQLFLKSCKISGDIPEWISTQKSLEILQLSENQLTGRFPLWLAEMEIGSILLTGNKLTGSIPSALFQSQSLAVLALSRNNFSGELPQNIGNAEELRVLMLSENDFSGTIPESIADIRNLCLLDLSMNRFSGNTPNFNHSYSLSYVDFSYNELSGEIPTSLWFTAMLALGGNRLSGIVPRDLTNLTGLEYLDLHDNNITGDFPAFLFQISTLQVLNIRNNSLHGPLSSNLYSNQSRIRILDLSNNNLVGSIPSELGNLKNMSATTQYIVYVGGDGPIGFDWNEATLSIGDYTTSIQINAITVYWKNDIRGLSSHSQHMYSLLDLSKNKLSGKIPASLGNLKGLKLLNISHNRLSDYIPKSLGDLESIETMDLSNNNISGTIPQSFGKLKELSVLDVSNNKLSGKIPRGGQMDTMNNPSYFANNSGLCGMQINVICPEDEPTPDSAQQEEDDDVEQEPWFLWKGLLIGFPLGFISAVLTAFLSGYFVIPTQKYSLRLIISFLFSFDTFANAHF